MIKAVDLKGESSNSNRSNQEEQHSNEDEASCKSSCQAEGEEVGSLGAEKQDDKQVDILQTKTQKTQH